LRALARCFGTRDGLAVLGQVGWSFQRQEGRGAGNGVQLHERRKALKGEPHERIWHETRPAGSGRFKASRGRENLKALAVGRGKPEPIDAAAPGGETLKGKKPHGRRRHSTCPASVGQPERRPLVEWSSLKEGGSSGEEIRVGF
jgi:hypothetical protein